MKERIDINPVFTLVMLLAFILLVKIGSAEVQPWDEGLYAIRAQSILYHDDAYLDQSGYSPGGLYSGTYPPLTVWAVAATMAIFGENEFSLRLFSALCSLASLVLISLLTKRITTGDKWIAAPVILFVSLAWNTYSRQGMTDVPLVFFFSCLLLFCCQGNGIGVKKGDYSVGCSIYVGVFRSFAYKDCKIFTSFNVPGIDLHK